jgi:DNA-binding MarR family transcriptional regulator
MLDMHELEDQPLGYLLSRVANALRAEVTATVLDPLEVAFPQYLCMRVLSKYPGRSNAELARDLNVTPQAMNMVLHGLEDRGLVTRPATVSSGRSLPAELTRAGQDLLKRTDAGVRAAERKLMANLTAEQRRDFKRILVALGSD